MDVKFCAGCEDDFYNGHNEYGIKKCWALDDAKRDLFKLIPIDMVPPYLRVKSEQLPTCYKKKRHVKAKLEAFDSEGYWRA